MDDLRFGQIEMKFDNQAAIFSRIVLDKILGEEGSQGAWNYPIAQGGAGHYAWSTNAATVNLKIPIATSGFSEVEENTSKFNTIEGSDDRVTDLISKIRQTWSIPDRETIAQRLFELVQDLRDEEPGSAGISLESLRSFYSFLQGHGYLKKPAIGLTPTNEIYVSWKAGHDSVFSIHFLESGLSRFAIIASATRFGQKVRLSGTANTEDLVDKVKPWGVIKWAGREEQNGTND